MRRAIVDQPPLDELTVMTPTNLVLRIEGHERALAAFGGKVSDSGEGRWTIAAANDLGVPAHVLAASLFERFASRDLDLFQNKVLSAMRFGFGGHVEKK